MIHRPPAPGTKRAKEQTAGGIRSRPPLRPGPGAAPGSCSRRRCPRRRAFRRQWRPWPGLQLRPSASAARPALPVSAASPLASALPRSAARPGRDRRGRNGLRRRSFRRHGLRHGHLGCRRLGFCRYRPCLGPDGLRLCRFGLDHLRLHHLGLHHLRRGGLGRFRRGDFRHDGQVRRPHRDRSRLRLTPVARRGRARREGPHQPHADTPERHPAGHRDRHRQHGGRDRRPGQFFRLAESPRPVLQHCTHVHTWKRHGLHPVLVAQMHWWLEGHFPVGSLIILRRSRRDRDAGSRHRHRSSFRSRRGNGG
ncbi:hypothetical protein BN1110_03528 [bacterium YEK0313]|nr:hypothetical protein BN1110_03528 [bacterium YEK0313]